MKKPLALLLLPLVMLLLAGLCCAPAQNVQSAQNVESPHGAQGLRDGQYAVKVTLEGGSGRAGVDSPAKLVVKDGRATATLVWSSPYYEWMRVDGVRYDPVQAEGNATFVVPVTLDTALSISAQTSAMSAPHEVMYTLYLDSSTLTPHAEGEGDGLPQSTPGTAAAQGADTQPAGAETFARGLGNGWEPVGKMELQYATQFAVDAYAGGYRCLTLGNGSRFLIVPEGAKTPAGIDGEIVVLQQPVDHIYLVATSAMCLFDALDRIDAVSLSGARARDWYVQSARAAMEDGRMQYAGKYSEPDYERILSDGCRLAIESTMILHAPEVKEKLEELGVPVMIERSSYEPHPLGRTEWIKLYGALLGKDAEAERVFNEQSAYLDAAGKARDTGKTVAFFYISTAGYAVVRKPGDYVSRMIELAGGRSVFEGSGDMGGATSTAALEMERFYAAARDADVLIYNSAIDGELESLDELLAKSALLEDFKAVQSGNVWCMGENLFQETTRLGQAIFELHSLLASDGTQAPAPAFFHRLRRAP